MTVEKVVPSSKGLSYGHLHALRISLVLHRPQNMRSGRQDQGAAHRRSGAVRQSGCPSRWEIIRARHQRCAVVLAVVWHKARTQPWTQQSRPRKVLPCLMENPLCYGVLLNLPTDVICFSLGHFVSWGSRRPRAGLRSGVSRPVTT